MNEMSAVVDLTHENDDNGDVPPYPVPEILRHQIQQHHVRIRVDMCPVSKPSVRFGPGRGTRGPGMLFRRYFDTDVSQKIEQLRNACIASREVQGIAIIPRQQCCIVKAWFFMKRPNDDFRGRVRGPGRLKEESTTYEETIVPVKPDVDNFGKFLLDSLTGALFVDDAQVVALHMYKLRDNEGMCNGRMQIECSLVDEAQIIVPNW
jgi:Endodeoxyribonuclease RusA